MEQAQGDGVVLPEKGPDGYESASFAEAKAILKRTRDDAMRRQN